MDGRANMRAMLENARQSIRNRAANTTGAPAKAKVATIASTSASASSSSAHARKAAESRAAPEGTAEALHFVKDTTSGADGAAAANSLNAKDNRMQFVQHYYRLLSAFIEDKSKYELELPNLSALDRVVVHALAEKCNLSHESAGNRADRVMHLKKDILFFQHPEAAQQVNLDEIIEKVSWKESKYQIRYVRSANPAQVAVGDIGSYADEDALEKIQRFRRATDEYRHATDMGYTQQELLLAESKGGEAGEEGEENYAVATNVEEILSRQDPSPVPAITAGPSTSASAAAAPAAATAALPASSSSPTSSTPPTAPSTAARAMKAAASASASAPASAAAKVSKPVTTVVFDEVCRACGSRVHLDGPPQGWRCSHYCAQCARQTIWSLEEVKVQEPTPAPAVAALPAHDTNAQKRGRDKAEAEGAEAAKKRRRTGLQSGAAAEAIDRDEGEEEMAGSGESGHVGATDDEETEESESDADDDITVEDVLEVAATNDFSAKDVNWLREFAGHAKSRLGRQIAFCIDFSDLQDMPIFERYDKAANAAADEAQSVWYVVLREARELSLSVSDLLRDLVNEVFASPAACTKPAVEEIQTEEAETRAMEHLAVAFPNLSVYGTECVVVCQLRPVVRKAVMPTMQIKVDGLRALRQRYGERHVFMSQSLKEAVAHAVDSTSA